MATKTKKKLTKQELRALLPEKLNKLGEWFFSDDTGKLTLLSRQSLMKRDSHLVPV